jgi:hypothetical protein
MFVPIAVVIKLYQLDQTANHASMLTLGFFESDLHPSGDDFDGERRNHTVQATNQISRVAYSMSVPPRLPKIEIDYVA